MSMGNYCITRGFTRIPRFSPIAGPNNLYQPSAISAAVTRQGPFERYQYQTTGKCRVGGQGPPGVPAAGGGHSSKPATREGVPWGSRKERRKPTEKSINFEPYQTLKPSGNWMHGTKQRQPANKQVEGEERRKKKKKKSKEGGQRRGL